MSSRNIALSVAAVVVSLLGIELAARVWIALRWPPGMAYELTHLTPQRGRFGGDPWNGYGLSPSFSFGGKSQNALAFRGPEIRIERTPGLARVVLIGASTVYGPRVADSETSSAGLEALLKERGIAAEVVNAGVPGYTTRETVQSLEHRVLRLRPDVVVVVDGRNDAYPELFRGYRDDYSHYRDFAWSVRLSNQGWKRVFLVSHLVMGLMHRQARFGFDPGKEHPLYGSIRYENKPSLAEAARFAADPTRYRGFETNVRRSVELIRAAGAQAVLATIPYRGGPWYASGNLDKSFQPIVSQVVAKNQEIVRRLAVELGTPLVDTPDLWTGTNLADDCHFNPVGERAFAERIALAVAPLLRGAPRAPQ